MSYEDVHIKSEDGIPLHGWLMFHECDSTKHNTDSLEASSGFIRRFPDDWFRIPEASLFEKFVRVVDREQDGFNDFD